VPTAATASARQATVVASESKPTAAKPAPSDHESKRYGESVVREILSASFIEEQTVAPRVTPREN
jgi:DNA polymerase-3 subunit gamma/tau